jgi:hypothetical protein
MDPSLWQSLVALGQTCVVLAAALIALLVQLLALAAHWVLLIVWVAWWLRAVNWQKVWPVLRSGGWAPLVLLMLVVALAWSCLQPVPSDSLLPNFWWQFGYVILLVAVALFCGWLQGVLDWAPAELSLEPPALGHDNGHGHATHH